MGKVANMEISQFFRETVVGYNFLSIFYLNIVHQFPGQTLFYGYVGK